MSGYVSTKYDNGYDIKMILNYLKMPTLENSEALDSMQTTWIKTSTKKT